MSAAMHSRLNATPALEITDYAICTACRLLLKTDMPMTPMHCPEDGRSEREASAITPYELERSLTKQMSHVRKDLRLRT